MLLGNITYRTTIVHAVCCWLKCHYGVHDYSVLGTKRQNNLDARISENPGSTCHRGPLLICHLQWSQVTTFSLPFGFNLLTVSPLVLAAAQTMEIVSGHDECLACSHSSALEYGGAELSSWSCLLLPLFLATLKRIPTRPALKKSCPRWAACPNSPEHGAEDLV